MSQTQGTQLQGTQLQGTQLQGMSLLGLQFAGASLNGSPLANLRVQQGDLYAEQGGTTLHGAALDEAHLFGVVSNGSTVEFKIDAIDPESGYDPTNTGGTYLYTISQSLDGGWQPVCPVDSDGRRAAIPVAAIWNSHGDRVESSTQFTMACTTGVIAKCYRWGYRPWLTGYGDVVSTHQACTRMARADYCGNGSTHTHDGTAINVWDNLPSPGPIQQRGTPPLLMLFEAGWNTAGAVCLSHGRWLLGGPIIALGCPSRLIPPGLGILNATVCDSVAQVLGQAADARIFDDSNLNLNLDLL